LTASLFFWFFAANSTEKKERKRMKEKRKDGGGSVGSAPLEKPLKLVGVVGSRTLHHEYSRLVGDITQDLIARQYHIATGGAIGCDEFVIEQLLRKGLCHHCSVYAAWQNYAGFPIKVRAMMRQFKAYNGHILWGAVAKNDTQHLIKMGLLIRNRRLVDACYGLIAFIDSQSRGSIYTIKQATEKRLTVVVFPINCELPDIDYVKWVPLKCGGIWDGSFKAVYLK